MQIWFQFRCKQFCRQSKYFSNHVIVGKKNSKGHSNFIFIFKKKCCFAMFNILFFTFCLAPAQPLGDDSSDSLLNAKLHLHGIPINCAKFYGTSPSKSPVVISG